MLPDIQTLLEQASARHSHLCPRQVLGVRMALAGAAALGLELPRNDKTLLVIAETDGCFVDGLEVAAGVTPGHRTLRKGRSLSGQGPLAGAFQKGQRLLRRHPRRGKSTVGHDKRVRIVQVQPVYRRRHQRFILGNPQHKRIGRPTCLVKCGGRSDDPRGRNLF